MENERNIIIKFRVNEEENKLLESKLKVSKCKSRSRFIRLMILEGVILHFDEEKVKKLMRQFSNISGNINQIAMRVNSTNNIYSDDINEIKKGVQELWQQLNYFLSLLQRSLKAATRLNLCCTSSRFSES